MTLTALLLLPQGRNEVYGSRVLMRAEDSWGPGGVGELLHVFIFAAKIYDHLLWQQRANYGSICRRGLARCWQDTVELERYVTRVATICLNSRRMQEEN